jgi:hypothetical protein
LNFLRRKKNNLRPVTLPELIAFSIAYPNLQRQFPIVAFGSVWQDRDSGRSVPYLWVGYDCRYLSLYWRAVGWDDGYRFLAVRK